MRVGIVGSREFPNLHLVSRYIERIAAKYPDAWIISGGARGVDLHAEVAASAYGLQVVSYRPYEYTNLLGEEEFSIETLMIPEGPNVRRVNPPFFKTFRDAAFHRNGWIVEDSDHVVAFHHADSSGTADTIRKATLAGKLRETVAA